MTQKTFLKIIARWKKRYKDMIPEEELDKIN